MHHQFFDHVHSYEKQFRSFTEVQAVLYAIVLWYRYRCGSGGSRRLYEYRRLLSDRKISGDDYREFALVRIDGENWVSDEAAENDMYINKKEEFKGWEDWKARNKAGIDCTFSFERTGNTITTITENMGIYIKNVTTIDDDTTDVYAALTGDQVALTNISIM